MRRLRIVPLMIIMALGLLACEPVPASPTAPPPVEATAATEISAEPFSVIASPQNGEAFEPGLGIEVESGSFDGQGIARVELLVDDGVVDTIHAVPEPNAVLGAKHRWMPEEPGTYSLQVRAYDAEAGIILSAPVTVEVVTVAAVKPEPPTETATAPPTVTPTATPSPTSTPLSRSSDTLARSPTPPSPASSAARLVVTTPSGLNVREGPSTRYRAIGRLEPGDEVEIVGQGNVGAGRWWQIRFPSAPTEVAWVSASSDFSKASNTENVPLTAPPPTPSPPPPTHTPTPIPVAEQTRIDFGADRTQIQAGECVTLFWNVTNVKEVYYNGTGVPGASQARRECPGFTTYYTLRVVTLDGSTETRTIQVDVVGNSFQTIEMDLGESVDFDDNGRVSDDGDDFIWEEDNGDREFRKWDDDDDLELVPVGPAGLDVIRREDCEWALDNLNDTNSIEPFDGLAACFRTDDGRIGKLRFEDTGDEAEIEWLVWD